MLNPGRQGQKRRLNLRVKIYTFKFKITRVNDVKLGLTYVNLGENDSVRSDVGFARELVLLISLRSRPSVGEIAKNAKL